MRQQLRSGIAAAETALRPPAPLAPPEREPLIVITSGGMQTTDPCCQVQTRNTASVCWSCRHCDVLPSNH